MTKLEEKLIELGYRQAKGLNFVYLKDFDKVSKLYIHIDRKTNHIKFSHISGFPTLAIENEMQKDLKELEQCQD